METLVVNPETGRWIKKDGTVYTKLKKKGVSIPLEPSKQRRIFVPQDIEKENKPIGLQKKYTVDKSQTKWEQKKPHSTKQRKKLLEKCKDSCFLMPEKMKFPICNKVSSTDKKCSYNCKGIKAAAARAGEWKYKNVLDKAKSTATQLDCYKKKKR